MTGILIFAETDEGLLQPHFWEQISAARQLAPQLGSVRVVAQGWEIKAEAARRSGADEVYVVEDERLAEPWPDAHLAAFTTLCRELQPALIVMPRTILGLEMAARLAYRLGGGLAQDAMTLQAADGSLTVTRPVFGGAASATLRLTRPPWIVVPRPGAFAAAEPTAEPAGKVISVRPELPDDELKTKCVSRARQKSEKVSLERAQVIISGGRGLAGPEPFKLLQQIADVIGAAVGASRPPCDSGWAPTSYQIGLTGKTVSPEVYIAVGVSGATQHMMGCSSARTIVAINNDRDAPIFHMATYGVVGDWKEVLPAFHAALADK